MTTLTLKIQNSKNLALVLERLKDIEGIEIEENTPLIEQIRAGLQEVKDTQKNGKKLSTLREFLDECR